MLSIYLFLTLIIYEYFIRFISTNLNLNAVTNLLDFKLKLYTIFIPSVNKFNFYLILSFFLSLKCLSSLKLGILTIFIFLTLQLWGLAYWKQLYLYISNHVNLAFISFSFYITILVLFLILICNNFILFLLILETIAVLYYFFFLNIVDSNVVSLLKYKNFLILYLLNSLFTTIFFSIGLAYLAWKVGTLTFSELNYFTLDIFIGIGLITFSLGWKLGLPGLHFFKLELYNYISLSLLFFFSSLSLILNSYIIIIYYVLFKPILAIYLNTILTFILLISSMLVNRGLTSLTGYQFIAYSTIITLTLVIVSVSLISGKIFL